LFGGAGVVIEPDKNCVLFFAKYPQKGQVKKRLSMSIGEGAATELYRNFVLDSLSVLERSGVQFLVCFHPPDSQKRFIEWLGKGHTFMPQRGDDLGQRMRNGFFNMFDRNYQRVIVIGSDSPDLPGAFIDEALVSLKTNDVVIGPSFDGGYYLIGFRHDTFLPEAFDGISWSTDTVFSETLTIVKNAELRLHVLPSWNDIDTCDDLEDLIERNRNTDFRESMTFSYLSNCDGIST
jgi:hypothetical protein